MMALIGKEMRMTLRSLVFYLFVIASVFFYFTSYATEETWGELSPPVISTPQNMGTAEQPYYGWAVPWDTRSLAEQMKIHMQWDLNDGAGEKLRLGFPMEIGLDAGEKAALTAAISQLDKVLKDPGQYTMDEVYQIAEALNSELGGSSMYQQGLSNYGYATTSIDEAMKAQEAQLAEYNAKVDGGELLPGAARYFSDYLSLPAGIFPVFLSAFLLLRDRSSRMNELIYSRRVSPWVYVGSKFIAQGIMLSLVYLILAVIGGWQTVDTLGLTGQTGQAIRTFLSYTAWWLLPTLWISVAFGMFGSMLFRRGIVPIALQIIWWFVSVLPLMGSYGLSRLFIRFNSPNDYNLYRGWADEIALNRSFYLLLAILLTAGAAWLWERNRSRLDAAQSLGRRKTKRTPAVPASGALR
ncbi:ABC transporter permease [Paenibacillus sp. FSL R7-0179]|uniref:ABC transporter permease n=1 Tax=Paenibacillus sp. FSL R7-0179 TaxID=2921672 RepID=UPI0030F6B3AA